MRNVITLFCIFVATFVCGAAWAAPAADVLGDPLGFADHVSALWRSGAILSTIVVVSFAVLKVLQAKVAWFGEGKRAVWISAAIGGLSLLVDGVSSGATPNLSMLVIAVTTTLAQLQQPTAVKA